MKNIVARLTPRLITHSLVGLAPPKVVYSNAPTRPQPAASSSGCPNHNFLPPTSRTLETMKPFPSRFHLVCALVLSGLAAHAAPLDAAFTYQGRLNNGGSAANGVYDLRFTLYDALSGGAAVGGSVTNAVTGVTNGLFTVSLDFGGIAFDGNARWLGIEVRTNGGGDFVPLSPRQPLSPAPNAIYATKAGTAITAATAVAANTANAVAAGSVGTAGLAPGAVDSSRIMDGTIGANDLSPAVLSNTFWRLGGNAGATPGANFLGTADNQALELKVNGQRALRLEPNATSPNTLAGHSANLASNTVYGATIGGGGSVIQPNKVENHFGTVGGGARNSTGSEYDTVSGGFANRASGFASSVAGGWGNQAAAQYTVVAGGFNNAILAGNGYVGGGAYNTNRGSAGVIAGGSENSIGSLSSRSVIAGGERNAIGPEALQATIGGGFGNTIQTNASSATIAGGTNNTIETSAYAAAIAGGEHNRILSSGLNYGARYSFIGGGADNSIDFGALAAGILGGFGNQIGYQSDQASIGGGAYNQIEPNAAWSVIGGGQQNFISLYSYHATIPGGFSNRVVNGSYSLAAGRRASALHPGTFVWGDSTNAEFASTSSNQFLIRASGGVGIGTNHPQAALHVAGTVKADGFSGSGAALTSLSGAALADSSVAASKFAPGAVNHLDAPDGSPLAALQVNTNGLAGIGTATPRAGLDIQSSGTVVAPRVLFEVDFFHSHPIAAKTRSKPLSFLGNPGVIK